MTDSERAALARLTLLTGDITEQDCDAIVNAANRSLAGGGGVDGAIHRAAGPGLVAECARRWPRGCPTGEVRLTGGHGLVARHVIHTVGPVWRGGGEGEAELLASCFESALALAASEGFASVAFPAVSAGAYGYPPEQAAAVTIAALARGLAANPTVSDARLVLFGEALHAVYARAYELRARCAPR